MSFLKRNITILILVASIISAFALNILAAPSVIEDFNYTDEITIQRQRHRGAYPRAIEVVLDTISETRMHQDYIAVYCTECGINEWVLTDRLYDPVAEIVYEFPSGCWVQDHYKVYFRFY